MEKARRSAEQIVDQGLSVNTALETLSKAMKIVDQRFERKEFFVIDVASSAASMREAFKVFEPHLKVEPAGTTGKIVIGSLKGNVQALGKDIVAATLRAAGLQVVNLGVDVAPEEFVRAAVHEKAQVIGISISMEETVPYLKDVVDILKQENLRAKIKVIIGGSAVSERTRRDCEVDAYAVNYLDSVKKVKTLLS